jgi:hypothetical protein
LHFLITVGCARAVCSTPLLKSENGLRLMCMRDINSRCLLVLISDQWYGRFKIDTSQTLIIHGTLLIIFYFRVDQLFLNTFSKSYVDCNNKPIISKPRTYRNRISKSRNSIHNIESSRLLTLFSYSVISRNYACTIFFWASAHDHDNMSCLFFE